MYIYKTHKNVWLFLCLFREEKSYLRASVHEWTQTSAAVKQLHKCQMKFLQIGSLERWHKFISSSSVSGIMAMAAVFA